MWNYLPAGEAGNNWEEREVYGGEDGDGRVDEREHVVDNKGSNEAEAALALQVGEFVDDAEYY